MIRILIAEDMQMLRESLKYMIESDNELQVVALAQDGFDAIAKCEKYNPDIIIMDMKMPSMDGFEATEAIKKKYPAKKVIALSTFNSDEYVKKAIDNGADGFITKDLGAAQLTQSIKSVHLGLKIFQDTSYKKNTVQSHTNSDQENYGLSEREIKIIKLVSEGKSYREIGDILHISEGTVRNIVYNLLGRFNLNDRIQLAVFAAKKNII